VDRGPCVNARIDTVLFGIVLFGIGDPAGRPRRRALPSGRRGGIVAFGVEKDQRRAP
jgi:hypothetical protein